MSSGVVSLYQPCFLVLPHYRSCLLVWCLIISDACWCGSSLWTMSVDVVSHYRPCLLVNRHCNHHFTSLVQMKKGWFKSGATCTEVPLYQTCLLIQCNSQICLLVQCNSIRICILGLFIQIRKASSTLNPSDMPTCRVRLPRVCKTCQLPFWMPS